MPQQIHSLKTPFSKSYISQILNADLQCGLTVILCLALGAFCVNLLHVPTVSIISSIALLNIILLVLMYILLAKSSLNIPNLGITFVISFCAVMVFNLSHNMAFVGLSFTLIIAPLSLWLTQSYIHCFISLFTQLINIILLFRLHLEDAMKYMPFEKIADKISLSITLASFGVILVFGYVFHDKMNLIATSSTPLGQKYPDHQLNSMFNQTRLLTSFTSEAKSLMETLLGSLNLLVSHIEPGLGQKLANIAFVSTENLQRLIDNIIDINSDKLVSRRSESIPTCIVDLFSNTWNSMLLLIHKKGLEGNLFIDKSLPEMVGVDNGRLKQIIVNLVDYFIHTTSRGPVSMIVEKIEVAPRVDYTDLLCATIDEVDNAAENVSNEADEQEPVGFSCSKVSEILRKLRPRKQLERMLKITIRNGASKDKVENTFHKQDEDFQSSPIDDMARLSLHVSKKLCEKLGGKMTMYTKDMLDQAYIVYIPFEVLSEGKSGKKGQI